MSDEITSPDFGLKTAIGFTLEEVDGTTTAVLEITAAHLNPHGTVHGAVPFTMMDTAMGGAVVNALDEGRLCATIEMQTRFHRPVVSGTLTATASIVTAGRRVVHLRAETHDQDDRLVASATASFAVFEV